MQARGVTERNKVCKNLKKLLAPENWKFDKSELLPKLGKFSDIYRATVAGHVVAVKVIPNGQNTVLYDWRPETTEREIRILRRCTRLVRRMVTQNLPLLYFTYKRTNLSGYGNRHLHDAPRDATILVMELSNCDMKSWMKNTHSPTEWKSAIFQALAGLAALQEHYTIVHRDLHWGNVFCDEVKSGGYWHYRFITEHHVYDYYVPNTGQVWKIADFGQSRCYKVRDGDVQYDMADDVYNLIQGNIIAPLHQSELRRGYKMHTLSSGDTKACMKAIVPTTSRHVPAFVALQRLGWFTAAPEWYEILNGDTPFCLVLTKTDAPGYGNSSNKE